MEYAAVFEQLLNCQARLSSQNTLEVVSRETLQQSLRLSFTLAPPSVTLKYACAPAISCELSHATCRPGSRAFCAGYLAGKASLLLAERGKGHRMLPAKQRRRAMLSVSYGSIDFVEFVVGFVEGLTGQPTRILFVSSNMCAFKVSLTVVSLAMQQTGVAIVMPYGHIATVAAPPGVSRDGFMFSGFGLDRYLAETSFKVAGHVSATAAALIREYHAV